MTRRLLPAVAAALLAAGCGSAPRTATPTRPAAAAPRSPIRFEEVSAALGVDFRLGNGGRSPLTILETAGGGCAFVDADQDGWPDLLLVGPGRAALYRNREGTRFEPVALPVPAGKTWMGCAVGDYDGDGRPDLLLTGYGCLALLRNLDGSRFQDVTAQAGLAVAPWSMSAAFGDVDGDGDLDLYLAQYLKFDSTTQQICGLGQIESACGPEVYEPYHGILYLNQNGRGFTPLPPDRWRDTGKTWGVLISRLAEGPFPALYMANDMMPCDLAVREGSGYRNRGPASGTAYDGEGHLIGAMGVDSGDYDNDGDFDLHVTTFFTQPTMLYRNDGGGLFAVQSSQTGLAGPTAPFVGFGTAFADFDADGWLDILLANGHVRDNVAQFDQAQSYAQPTLVFRNRGGREFEEVSAGAGEALSRRIVGRGLSVADFDRDGRLDAVICDLEGSALLLRNVSQPRRTLTVRLQARGRNRFGLGAVVRARTPSGSQTREVRTCGSVLSAFDPVAHFGLGGETDPVQLEITWADGRTQREVVPPDVRETLIEQE